MLASAASQRGLRLGPQHQQRARIAKRARVVVRSGEESNRELESAFEKELRRRGLDSGSIGSVDEDAAPAAAPRSPFDQQAAQQQASSQQRSAPRPPPSFRGSAGEMDTPDQLARSRALNSEGLEGFLPRATELLKLGGLFFLGFAPFILAVVVGFGAVYAVFGDSFVHYGTPASGPPPYIDPDMLLAEPTADPMIPLDLR